MMNYRNSKSGVPLEHRQSRLSTSRSCRLGTPVRAEIALTRCKQTAGVPLGLYTIAPRPNSKLKTSPNANSLLGLAVVLAQLSLRISKPPGENGKAN
jgi:hypothetical protein